MIRRILSLTTKLRYFLNAVWLLLSKFDTKPEKTVIVCMLGHGRALKIAKALNHEGVRPSLITRNSDLEENTAFDKVLLCTSDWHALYLSIKYYKGSVFHILCSWNYTFASIMIMFNVGRIIIDTFDVLNYFMKPVIKKEYSIQFKLEKWCMTRAHGLVCRDLRTNLLKKNNWFLPPRILFMDYITSPSSDCRIKKLSRDIVYLGNVQLDPCNSVAYQYDLSDILCENKIRFDIYPFSKDQANELRLKFKNLYPHVCQSGFLNVYDTILPEQIPNAISSSSYGLLISTKQVNYHDIHSGYNSVMSRYFFAGKIFDYYESGVFPITQKGMFISFVMKRMGVGVEVDTYEDIVTFIDRNENREVTYNFNVKLTLEHNASRLVAFYDTFR